MLVRFRERMIALIEAIADRFKSVEKSLESKADLIEGKIDPNQIDLSDIEVDTSTLATKEEIKDFITIEQVPKVDLTNYVQTEDIQDFITIDDLPTPEPAPDLTPYALKTDIPNTDNFITEEDLGNYGDKMWVDDNIREKLDSYVLKSDLPEQPDLTPYALKTEIPNVSEFLTLDDMDEFITENELALATADFITLNDLPEQEEFPSLDPYALKTDLPDLAPYALKTDIPEGQDLSGYALKTDLDNLVTTVDIEDFITLEDLPPEQDLSGYALKSEIPEQPDLSIYALKTDIPEGQDLSQYALKSDLSSFIVDEDIVDFITLEDLPDLTPYALKSDIPDPVDTSSFATKLDIQNFITADDLPPEQDLSGYALKTEIPDTSYFITLDDIPEPEPFPSLEPYALKTDIPEPIDTSGFATKLDIEDFITADDLPPEQDLSGYALKTEIPNTSDFITGVVIKNNGVNSFTSKEINFTGLDLNPNTKTISLSQNFVPGVIFVKSGSVLAEAEIGRKDKPFPTLESAMVKYWGDPSVSYIEILDSLSYTYTGGATDGVSNRMINIKSSFSCTVNLRFNAGSVITVTSGAGLNIDIPLGNLAIVNETTSYISFGVHPSTPYNMYIKVANLEFRGLLNINNFNNIDLICSGTLTFSSTEYVTLVDASSGRRVINIKTDKLAFKADAGYTLINQGSGELEFSSLTHTGNFSLGGVYSDLNIRHGSITQTGTATLSYFSYISGSNKRITFIKNAKINTNCSINMFNAINNLTLSGSVDFTSSDTMIDGNNSGKVYFENSIVNCKKLFGGRTRGGVLFTNSFVKCTTLGSYETLPTTLTEDQIKINFKGRNTVITEIDNTSLLTPVANSPLKPIVDLTEGSLETNGSLNFDTLDVRVKRLRSYPISDTIVKILTSGSYTLDSTFENNIIHVSGSCTLIIPVGLERYFRNCIFDVQAGPLNIVAGSGVTVTGSESLEIPTGSRATLYKRDETTNTYRLLL